MTELDLLRKTLRVLWVLLGTGLVCWIGLRNLPLDGKLRASAAPGEASWAVGILRPDDRVRLVRDCPPKGDCPLYELIDEPSYFSLGVPRFFRRARIRLEFRNDLPILELGARTELDRWAFDLKPMDAPVLDGLGWSVRDDETYRIYEKKPTNRSAKDILASGDAARTAVYHVDPTRWGMVMLGIRDTGLAFKCQVPSAKCQRFYTYVARPPFQISLELAGSASARVIKDGVVLLSRESTGGTLELGITNAEPGLYRVEIDGAGGTGIAAIRTRHARLWVVGEPPVPGFHPEFPVVNADWGTVPERGLSPARSSPAWDRIDTVVARYAPPRRLPDGWKSAEAVFDVVPEAIQDGEVQMIVSAPGLKASGEVLSVRKIEVEYEREPLWPSLKKLFRSI